MIADLEVELFWK